LVAYGLYRLALSPASDWSEAIRARIDVHRLDVYDKLGLRRPTSFADEREIALKLAQLLLYGAPPYLPDDLWGPKADDGEEETH